MGHSQNARKNTKQPEKGALDTDEDKGIEEASEPEENEEEEQTAGEPNEEKPIEVTEEEKTEPEPVPKEETVAPEEETEEAAAEEATEEVEKKRRREKAPAEEEIVEEKTYTIPLRRAWISPRKKRVPKAVRMVRGYVQRHMKIQAGPKTGEEEEEERLVISNEVNEKLWSRGIEKPPRNIRVRAVKNKEGTVTLYLAEGD